MLIQESLNNLGNLYSHTQRMKKAEAAEQEMLDIYRQLGRCAVLAGRDSALAVVAAVLASSPREYSRRSDSLSSTCFCTSSRLKG